MKGRGIDGILPGALNVSLGDEEIEDLLIVDADEVETTYTIEVPLHDHLEETVIGNSRRVDGLVIPVLIRVPAGSLRSAAGDPP